MFCAVYAHLRTRPGSPRRAMIARDSAMNVRPCVEPDRVHKMRLYRPADLRCRDGEHLREDLGLLRPRVAGPEPRRLLRGDDRPPADDHGARRRPQRERAAQPLPAPRRAARRQPEGQHRRRLRLLLPRLELPPRRQGARDSAGARLRGHAHDQATTPTATSSARRASTATAASSSPASPPTARRCSSSSARRRSPSTTCATARPSARSRSCPTATAWCSTRTGSSSWRTSSTRCTPR